MKTKVAVYIIHAQYLDVRKNICETLEEKLKASDNIDLVNFTYIEDHDPQTLSMDTIKESIDFSKSGKSDLFDSILKNLHVRQLSNALKHYKALEQAASLDDDTFALIIEDDIVFGEQVEMRLSETIKSLKTHDKWDAAFLGLPQPAHIISQENVSITPTTSLFKVVPCVDSYILLNKGAKKIFNTYMPIKYTTNVHLSYLEATNADINFVMVAPNVFIDGSKFGIYLSSLEANNKLFLNQDFNTLHGLVHKDEISEVDAQQSKELLAKMKFNNHPDILGLKAILEMKTGHYAEAKATFEIAYKTFSENESILNNESEFMLNYTKVFKYIQDIQI